MAFRGSPETPPPPPEAAGQDDNVDLELRLGLPPPRSIDRSSAKHEAKIPAAVETGLVVLELFTGPSESESSGTGYDTPEEPMSAPAPATEPLHEVDLGGHIKAEELVTIGEEACHGDIDASGTVPVPAWVRAELLPRHDLPRDMPLHFIGAKDLSYSDLDPRQARFLVPSLSGASDRLHTFLSAEEIQACGFDSAYRTSGRGSRSKRAKPTTYAGVPVSVYERGGVWGVSEQKLNKFHGTEGTVINGTGYTSFMGRCGFEAGDHVELWAFRWPSDHPCFVIAKNT